MEIALSFAAPLVEATHHPLAALPGFALRRAAQAMMAELAQALAPVDLKISEASVLLLLDGREDMTSSRIGELLDIQRANMVPLLGRLEAAGLIARVPIDRRSAAIVLSEEGAARLVKTRAVIERFEQDLLDRIPARHRDHLVPALNALIG